MEKAIFFDMDGTLNKFYEIENWLKMLNNYDPTPYKIAPVNLNMNILARKLNKLQKQGYKIGIISWLSKYSTPEYDQKVIKAKIEWLRTHLNSVKFDEIKIVAYGTPKYTLGQGILFDDEDKNRIDWGENAFHPSDIMKVLSSL